LTLEIKKLDNRWSLYKTQKASHLICLTDRKMMQAVQTALTTAYGEGYFILQHRHSRYIPHGKPWYIKHKLNRQPDRGHFIASISYLFFLTSEEQISYLGLAL